MSEPTYTTAQIHVRLGVPKPTIRNWSADYASFLSERAHPGDSKIRQFTEDDLLVLNTVRHFTRVEGLTSSEQIRRILENGQRVTDLPARRTVDEEQALASVDLAPVAEIKRAMDKVGTMQTEVARLSKETRQIMTERDQALIALDEANQQIMTLRESHGHLRGVLAGVSTAGVGLALLIGAGLIAMAIYLLQIQR